MSDDINESINAILNAVDNLRKIDKLANWPYINQQMINMGYIIIEKLTIFRPDVRYWLRRNHVAKRL